MVKKCIHIGLYLIVLSIPISIRAHLFRDENPLFSTKIPVVDLLILLVFILWVIQCLRTKSFHEVKWIPHAFWAFLIFAAVSSMFAHNSTDSLKDLIQIIDYYFIGYILFINNVESRKHLLRIMIALFVVTILVTLYGLYQYPIHKNNLYLVNSMFDDRHVLAGFLIIVLPVLFGSFLFHQSKVLRILIWITLLGAIMIITSIPAYIILCGTLCAMMFILRKPVAAAAIIAFFLIILALPLGIKLNDIRALKDSLIEPHGIENYHLRINQNAEMSYQPEIGSLSTGRYDLIFTSKLATAKTVPEEYLELVRKIRSKDELYRGGHLIQRILEWQAALNIVKDKPLLGVGIGNYQNEIGHYYQSFPKLNTMEPSTQNGYLIITATMGFVGLGSFFWILFTFWKSVRVGFRNRKDQVPDRLSLGLFGSLTTFSLYNFFCPLVNHTTVILFVVLMAFAKILSIKITDEISSD